MLHHDHALGVIKSLSLWVKGHHHKIEVLVQKQDIVYSYARRKMIIIDLHILDSPECHPHIKTFREIEMILRV